MLRTQSKVVMVIGIVMTLLFVLSEIGLLIWWYVNARVFWFLAAVTSKGTDCVCECASPISNHRMRAKISPFLFFAKVTHAIANY